jgi:short-subunit dehydrogenase
MSRGTVLITGASSGIGEAFARRFAQDDFELILTARRQDRLQALQDELGKETVVQVLTADLSATGGIDHLITTIDRPVDILINNAGMAPDTSFETLDADQITQTIELNITALTRLTHHYMTKMRVQGQGRILNVASVAAFHPVPGMDIYAATKAYVLSLSESLSENLRGTGVSVTALCPGLTSTEMADPVLMEQLPPFLKTTPEAVADEGFEAIMNREVIRVPGEANKLALAWAQHQPRWLVRGLGGLAARITGSR